MRSRRADSVIFGFDFQVNAAIVLMLENIRDLSTLRLEGNYEDIEVVLNNNQYILAQAKAIVNSSSDFSHVRQNLQKALLSLSEGCQKVEVKQLILVTNSPNPLNDEATKGIFLGVPAHRKYSTLPPSSQELINKYIGEIDQPLDLDKFFIQTLPFETDEDVERYKFVMQEINDFVGALGINIPGFGKRLLEVWHWDIFKNGCKKDASIQLTKKNIIWPIMVIATDVERCNDDFLNQFDPALYDEIVRRYKIIIDTCCERVEFFTKVLYDYKGFQSNKKGANRFVDFIENTWKNYEYEFDADAIDSETQEDLIKVILYNIIYRRIAIDKIKKEVNL